MAAPSQPPSSSDPADQPADAEAGHCNEVHVVGRLAAATELRELPSGDEIAVWRLIVQRDGPPVAGRPHLDTLECVGWPARLRRTATGWTAGDLIEVDGALRRRFWRAGPALHSRYEIEARTARRVKPAKRA